MKAKFPIHTIVPILMAFLLLLACERTPKGDEAKISDADQPVEAVGKTLAVDSSRSWVRFTGNGVGKNHPGIFKISYGTVSLDKDSVSAGTFMIDINSLRMEQRDNAITSKLRPHLLSGDFLDAEKFGTAKFEITDIIPYQPKDSARSLVEGANLYVSGNLTLKDVTKNISFPARVDLDGETLKAKANFDIDRRQWQMNYRNDKALGDKFISEVVNIELYVEARPQENM
jgi:polyisoprenoid-binding protein YceI